MPADASDALPTVSQIVVYPLKSCDGVAVDQAIVLENGALEHDRAWILFDRDHQLLNAKREPLLHTLRVRHPKPGHTVQFSSPEAGDSPIWDLADQAEPINQYLSKHFHKDVLLRHYPNGGLPDDLDAPGPTIVSVPSLQRVQTWFDEPQMARLSARFRANILLHADAPFWEDRLVGQAFTLGSALLFGTNVCQRCVVPTRDPLTGEPTRQFTKTFTDHRQAELPAWAPADHFNHYYRFTLNTKRWMPNGQTPSQPQTIRVGDSLGMLDQPTGK